MSDLDETELAPGDRVDQYVIVSKLGTGGFAEVYKARHGETGQIVAIKMLNADAALDKMVLRRFMREAHASDVLDHPNIVEVFAYGDHAKQPFLVMEFLAGETLAERVKRAGPIAPRDAVPILIEVTHALTRAHDNGIIHRDIKPENLFLNSADGATTMRVLDFGIAKFPRQSPSEMKTATRAIIGTLHTMSPEQCRSSNVDHRSDIYSLGVVAYFVLAGEYPFAHFKDLEIAVAHLREAPRPLREKNAEIPPSLAEIVHRCLEKDPARRYQSMRELRDALVATHLVERSGGKWRGRAVAAVVALAVAGLVGWLSWTLLAQPPERARPTATQPAPAHGKRPR